MRIAAERREAILQRARLRGVVRVSDLAEHLGVSTVTVRRDVTALVDEGLLDRVHGGATLRASTPGPSRRPATRASVGMVVPSASYYYPAVIRGAETAAAATGVRIVLAISHYHADEERDQVARLVKAGVHGLLLSTSEPPDTDPEIGEWVAGLSLPTVLLERVGGPAGRGLDYVRTDHAAGARLAVEHLAGAGHRTIALAAREGSPTTRWLIDGYREAMAALGLSDGGLPPTLLPRFDNDPRRRARHLDGLIDRCRDGGVTAVLVHVDEDAMAFAQTARARGLDVPRELAIVAYDDEVAALAEVPLTAVAPPKLDVGRTAVEVLMRRLCSDDPATQHVSLLPRLVVRASCGTADR
ncbi:MAG: LacI family DNA-binding transcriptional regulator [Micromonosporaceae bacterium]